MLIDRSYKFLKARKTQEVKLPELGEGCSIWIRELSVGQMSQLDKNLVRQLAMMIIDADGNQIYRTDEDLENLAEMPVWISTRIFSAANEMTAATESGKEEILKN